MVGKLHETPSTCGENLAIPLGKRRIAPLTYTTAVIKRFSMTTFPNSPRVLKGALIGVDPFNPVSSVVVFQYNPEKMTRTLTARASNNQQNQGEAFRLSGPPQEDIKLEVELDATDQLERVDPVATDLGVYPMLSALEMLLYPKSSLVAGNAIAAMAGAIEIIPAEAPLTLLVWGVKRILPVRISSFTINEEMFDTGLNPIMAKVSLDLKVLSYHDLGLTSVGGALFMAHQVAKEVMATVNGVGNVTSLPAIISR
jgi:hypothetical protein